MLCVSTFAASAHPGRTDSNGGHYNRSTGEYHYHHGYPAHDHKNGICPYQFDDKTGESSGSSTGAKNGYTERKKPTQTKAPIIQTNAPMAQTNTPMKKKESSSSKVLLFGGLLFVVSSSAIYLKCRKERLEREQKEEAERQRAEAERKEAERKEAERQRKIEKYRTRTLRELVGIPENIIIGSDGIPVTRPSFMEGGGDDICHVYVTSRYSMAYHRSGCVIFSQYSKNKINIYTDGLKYRVKERSACKMCKPSMLPDMDWYTAFQRELKECEALHVEPVVDRD